MNKLIIADVTLQDIIIYNLDINQRYVHKKK